jgi:hypothetical protein
MLRIPNEQDPNALVWQWQAQEMAGNASRFIQEELTMDRVYDYMFHLLTEYARLLRYCSSTTPCPSVPEKVSF